MLLNKLKYRIEKKADYYDTLCEYWGEHEFPIIPLSSLPNDLFICYRGKYDLYVIPLYLTNTDIAWIGFPTSNPYAPKKYKKGALKYIFDAVNDELKKSRFRLLLTTSDTPVLMDEFKKAGFRTAEKSTNFYTKKIK